jgi:hypothetical protein
VKAMSFIKLFDPKLTILKESLSKEIKGNRLAKLEKSRIDWQRVNIKINNSLVNKEYLQKNESIMIVVARLEKTHFIIREYISKLGHQDGFLTAGENYTTYSLKEKKGIQIKNSNHSYEFTEQEDGSVRLREQFDIVGYFKDSAPETRYAPKQGPIAKVTTETTIRLNPNNPERLVQHTLNSYRVDIEDNKLAKNLFNRSLIAAIRNAIKSALSGISKLFNFSRSAKTKHTKAKHGEWINPKDGSLEPSWIKPKGKY